MTTSHGEPAAHPTDEPFLYRRSGPVTLHLGDARQVLAALPDASVDCLVTSPPFWGLRDYGTGRWQGGDSDCSHPSTRRSRWVDGSECSRCGGRWVDPQYGLEESLDDYVIRLVAVFDEARRVLVETGTLWLNIGDSYSTGTTTGDRAASPVPVKYATASGPRVRDAMAAGQLGMIATPAAGNTVPTGVDWCADNSCFTPGRYPGDTAYVRWLGQRADRAGRCEFATAPDIPFNAAATLDRASPMLERIRAAGYPAALVAQDGLEDLRSPGVPSTPYFWVAPRRGSSDLPRPASPNRPVDAGYGSIWDASTACADCDTRARSAATRSTGPTSPTARTATYPPCSAGCGPSPGRRPSSDL